MAVTSPQQAEQGSTVRIPFATLLTGAPTDPVTVPFNVEIYLGQDEGGTLVETVPVVQDDVGKFHLDWAIPLAQTPGFYTAYVNPLMEAPATYFTDYIRFEVAAAGTYTTSSTPAAAVSQTQFEQISAARSEDSFVALVRTILRDHPQLNRLTKGRETSDGEILIAMNMVISQYNGTPPFLPTVRFANFPSVAWLVIGTIGWVLDSSTLLRVRNDLQYTDGGVSVNTENTAGYAAMVQQWKGRYDQWVPQYKYAKNLNDAWSNSPTGLHSEYYLLASMLGGFGVMTS